MFQDTIDIDGLIPHIDFRSVRFYNYLHLLPLGYLDYLDLINILGYLDYLDLVNILPGKRRLQRQIPHPDTKTNTAKHPTITHSVPPNPSASYRTPSEKLKL